MNRQAQRQKPLQTLFQDAKDKAIPKTYSGEEQRALGHQRPKFDPQFQSLADLIRSKSKCGDHCLINDENKPHINSTIETVTDHIKLVKKVKERIIFFLVIATAGGLLTLIGYGLKSKLHWG